VTTGSNNRFAAEGSQRLGHADDSNFEKREGGIITKNIHILLWITCNNYMLKKSIFPF